MISVLCAGSACRGISGGGALAKLHIQGSLSDGPATLGGRVLPTRERGFFGRETEGARRERKGEGGEHAHNPPALHKTNNHTQAKPPAERTMALVDDEEYVQLTIPEAFIYKVPPRTSAQGHK